MVANILPADHPSPTLWVGSKGRNSTFSEHGHVASQIKGNHKCCNRPPHPRTHPSPRPDPWGRVRWSKFNFFLTWSSCISNLMESRMQQHGSKYFARNPPLLTLGVGVKGKNSTLSEHDHVAYQINGNHECSNMVANILPAPPLPPRH